MAQSGGAFAAAGGAEMVYCPALDRLPTTIRRVRGSGEATDGAGWTPVPAPSLPGALTWSFILQFILPFSTFARCIARFWRCPREWPWSLTESTSASPFLDHALPHDPVLHLLSGRVPLDGLGHGEEHQRAPGQVLRLHQEKRRLLCVVPWSGTPQAGVSGHRGPVSRPPAPLWPIESLQEFRLVQLRHPFLETA